MFRPSRNPSRHSRSPRHRCLELLERREMFAADLDMDDARAWESYEETTQPVAVAGPTPGTDRGSEFVSTPTRRTAPPLISLTVGATFDNGVLTVTGTSGADHLNIYASEGLVYVREVVKQQTLLTVPATDLSNIVVRAHGGNDWVSIDKDSITVPATVFGGSGNDILLGGAGSDNLFGEAGNDELVGHQGNDVVNGGAGNDLVIGGAGNDTLSGDQGDDDLLGGDGQDRLLGGDGHDQLFGEAGNDYLYGDAGNDLLDGGAGNDAIYGGADVDEVYGGEGDDYLLGGADNDRLRGEGGNDTISGGDGADLIDGGAGNDVIRGNNGNDALSGGAGHDTIYGGANNDWLDGGAGGDALYGEDGKDWLQGGYDYDFLSGGAGKDKLYQDYHPDNEPMGQVGSPLSLGDVIDDVGDALEDGANAVGDFLTDVVEWSFDKAMYIARLHYDWVMQLDDRLLRLGDDLAETLTHWPWETEFWNGMGRVVLDTLEIAGIGEAFEIFFEFVRPWQRAMTDSEIAVASSVFGESIDYNLVRMDEYSLTAAIGRTHATGYIINSMGDIDDRTMIHELTHVWQYIQDGLIYIPEAIDAQNSEEGYDFTMADLEAKKAAGQGLTAFNREQQGEIVAEYFDLREYMRSELAAGHTASQDDYDDLDVYVHFVLDASTLSAQQLDVTAPSSHPIIAGRPSRRG